MHVQCSYYSVHKYMYSVFTGSRHASLQDVDRLHREVNGLNSTVAAQGQEVERLQRENRTLQGEIETHRITVSSSAMFNTSLYKCTRTCTLNPVYLTLLNFNVFLKTCVLTFIIITISQCVLVWKHTVPSEILLLSSAHQFVEKLAFKFLNCSFITVDLGVPSYSMRYLDIADQVLPRGAGQ